jgi:hypothetical protein
LHADHVGGNRQTCHRQASSLLPGHHLLLTVDAEGQRTPTIFFTHEQDLQASRRRRRKRRRDGAEVGEQNPLDASPPPPRRRTLGNPSLAVRQERRETTPPRSSTKSRWGRRWWILFGLSVAAAAISVTPPPKPNPNLSTRHGRDAGVTHPSRRRSGRRSGGGENSWSRRRRAVGHRSPPFRLFQERAKKGSEKSIVGILTSPGTG